MSTSLHLPSGLPNAVTAGCVKSFTLCVWDKTVFIKRLKKEKKRKDIGNIPISRWNHRGQIGLKLHLICQHDLELQR